MKRSLVTGAVLGLVLAASASAAQITLFASSTDATNGVVDANSALTLGKNPEVAPGGVRQLSIWMAFDPNSTGGAPFTGGAFDVAEVGGQTYASDLVIFQPARYGIVAAPGTAGGPGYTNQGNRFIPAGPAFLPQVPNDAVINGLNVFLLATGTFNANNPGGLYLEIPLGEVFAMSFATGTAPAGMAFGFGPGGVFDTTGEYFDGLDWVAVAQLGSNGFDSDTINYFAAIRTTLADVIVTPEPASMTLLLLGAGALLRRRVR
jgi:hypothetical protein